MIDWTQTRGAAERLAEARDAASARLRDAVDARAVARALLDGGEGPMVAIEAARRGVAPAALAAQIVANASAYRQLAAHMAGSRAAGEASIAAATDPAGVDAALAHAVAQLAALSA